MFFALIIGVSAISLGGCVNENTYYFSSITVQTEEETKEYKIGDETPNGVVLKKDFCTIRLEPDGTAVIKFKVGFVSDEMTGTWEEAEDEPGKIVITVEEDPLVCECDGSTLVISVPGNSMTLILKKMIF